MELHLRTYCSLCELTVESDNTTIVEDITFLNPKTKCYEADPDIIEDLITIAFEISRFNKRSDLDMVKEIFESFLNTSEQEEFLENLT